MEHYAKHLVPLKAFKALLIYDLQGITGAMRHAYVAAEVVTRLATAAEYVRGLNKPDRFMELLIWDAYRTKETQQAIYERYACDLRAIHRLSKEESYRRAAEFISLPTSVFPHGTGGAVDLTLLINGERAEMGTDFDAFVPEAASNYFLERPPRTKAEQEAASNRQILRLAMEHAGFVGLENEWWHFEWGTERWARKTKQKVILGSILNPPEANIPSSVNDGVPSRQPVLHTGVAQVFGDPASRAASLLHTKPGHYYARASHPTIHALGEYICHYVMPHKHGCFAASGLNACRAVLQSVMPNGGTVIYDDKIYYEVERELLELALRHDWRPVRTDFTDLNQLEVIVRQSARVNALFCDTPRNWWLEAIDVEKVSAIGKAVGAVCIADTSVQPLQDLLTKGVDIVVCSLSKYPSLGLTLGGAILCNRLDLHEQIVWMMGREGAVLSPEAAKTIWSQVISLHDRMNVLSNKAEQVALFLRGHAAVRLVRIPDRDRCGGFCGGQVTFHAKNQQLALAAEKIVGYNAVRGRSSLHLACTFGAGFTTFEHFASNTRLRKGLPREATNEIAILPDMVRVGIGCEPLPEIFSDLRFVLDRAMENYKLFESSDA